MLSLGIDASRAFCTASASGGFPSMSPPPSLAATVIARASLVKSLPRRASTMAFLCLIPAHLELPAMALDARSPSAQRARTSGGARYHATVRVSPLQQDARLPASKHPQLRSVDPLTV